jgi:hypothetical protein
VSPHDYATVLAAKGLPAFKLSNERKPIHKKYWEKASTNAEDLEAWLHAGNIGVATGGNFIVVDVDIKDGKPGHNSLAELKLMGLPLDTFTVRTTSVNGSGEPGLHLYYRVPAGYWHNRVRWLSFKGIDVLGITG